MPSALTASRAFHYTVSAGTTLRMQLLLVHRRKHPNQNPPLQRGNRYRTAPRCTAAYIDITCLLSFSAVTKVARHRSLQKNRGMRPTLVLRALVAWATRILVVLSRTGGTQLGHHTTTPILPRTCAPGATQAWHGSVSAREPGSAWAMAHGVHGHSPEVPGFQGCEDVGQDVMREEACVVQAR